MFYGNLIALMQKDFKRLLGFSGIAHAGYALIGFVALDQLGYTAALYYIIGYLLMVLACFVVICKVSRDGTNVAIEEWPALPPLPLLAVTLIVGVFALAGIPPFVDFFFLFLYLCLAELRIATSSGATASRCRGLGSGFRTPRRPRRIWTAPKAAAAPGTPDRRLPASSGGLGLSAPS